MNLGSAIFDIVAREDFVATFNKATASTKLLEQTLAKANAKIGAPTKAQIDRWEQYSKAVNEAATAVKNMPEPKAASTASTGSILSGLGKGAAQVLGIGIGAYALRQAADWTIATAEIGAGALDVERSLQRLSLAYGVNGQEITRQLIAMSHGSITEMDAMAQVNRALFAQNAHLARNLPQIFAVARAAAIKSGDDVMRVYDSLILGILRGSYRLIDNADIYLRVAEITERWAASLGTTVDEMSIQERQIAIENAILQDSVGVVGAATTTNASYAESWKAVSTAFTDWRREVGKGIIVETMEGGALDWLDNLFAGMTDTAKANREFKEALREAREELRPEDWLRSASAVSVLNYYLGISTQELARQKLEWKRVGDMMGGREALIAGSVAKPIVSIKPDLFSPAIRGSEQYKKSLDALSGSISLSQGYLRSHEAALKSEALALAALYAPAIRAAAGYRELGEAILEATGMFSAAQFGSAYNRAESGVSSALLSVVGLVPAGTLSSMYDEFIAKLPTVLSGLEAQGLSTFEANLDVEKMINSFQDFATTAKDSGKEAEKAMKGVQKTLEDLHAEIESVVLTGLEVTPQDILDTEAGVYVDKALEPVRRLRDIVEKGSESPFLHLFDIPPEVLASGEAAIKAWAQRMSDRGAALLDINLIDKDAFLRQWDQVQADIEAKKGVLNQLAQLLVDTGRVSTVGQGKASAAKMLGIDDPAIAGKSITDGLSSAIASADITGTVVANMIAEGKKREAEYRNAGKLVGEFWAGGIVEAAKLKLNDMRGVLVELLLPEIMSRLPTGVTPP